MIYKTWFVAIETTEIKILTTGAEDRNHGPVVTNTVEFDYNDCVYYIASVGIAFYSILYETMFGYNDFGYKYSPWRTKIRL